MSTQSLYCHNCNKTYNVRIEDIKLMQHHDANFDAKEYRGGCFFKHLSQIKRLKNQKKEQ